MCAMDAAAAGEKDVAANLTLRARDLVGEPAAKALLELIRETDEADAGDAPGSDSTPGSDDGPATSEGVADGEE